MLPGVGRTIRKDKNNPRKDTGYVLLPLLPLLRELESGESAEEVIQHTDFDEVGNVLAAMQEHDSEFADVIRTTRQEIGQAKGFDNSRL